MLKAPLAASVVMTFSVALSTTASACTGGEQATRTPPKPEPLAPPEGPMNPPPPELETAESGEVDKPVITTGPGPVPDDGGTSEGPKDSEPDPKPASATTRIIVRDNGDGTCTKYFRVDCPEGKTCEPPPPEVLPCTDDLWPKARNPEHVFKRESGDCFESKPMHCPEGASCNPPPPHRVSCASAGK